MSSLLTPKQTIFRICLWAATLATMFALALPAQAQTYTVLHNFTGGGDGAYPYAGVTMDRGGNLYGTASDGGNFGDGDVFKLTHSGSGWTLNPIYSFQGFASGDGADPLARVIFGPDGALYGTTDVGGTGSVGTVFRLTPQATACKTSLCSWSETVLHSFHGGHSDGAGPGYGDLLFDAAGNLYDTTIFGGGGGGSCNDSTCGTVYEVSPVGGGWSEHVIYDFPGGGGGAPGFWPYNGVILDSLGNLYGAVTWIGSVYELAPLHGDWSETTLYLFPGGQSAGGPVGGLIFDQSGNLYGTANEGGSGGGGAVFELSPSDGGWTLTTLYSFNYSGSNSTPGPTSTLTMDASGALYGNTYAGGTYSYGNIFKLAPSQGGWTYTSLHDFTGGSDGGYPWGQVILDANGNIYGTATAGGSTVGSCYQNLGCGVVFEITP